MCTQNYDQFIATFFSKHFKLISQPKQESTYAPNQALISCFAKITLEQYCHAFCCCFAKSQVKWVILNMQHELKEKETQMVILLSSMVDVSAEHVMFLQEK